MPTIQILRSVEIHPDPQDPQAFGYATLHIKAWVGPFHAEVDLTPEEQKDAQDALDDELNANG